jgi:drug/metabolite transporter (DMT)-like permease
LKPILANLVLLIVAAIWGVSFGIQSAAMKEIGPFWFTGIRFLLATLAVAPFALREGSLTAINSRDWLACIRRLIPLTQVRLYVVVLSRRIGPRFSGDFPA